MTGRALIMFCNPVIFMLWICLQYYYVCSVASTASTASPLKWCHSSHVCNHKFVIPTSFSQPWLQWKYNFIGYYNTVLPVEPHFELWTVMSLCLYTIKYISKYAHCLISNRLYVTMLPNLRIIFVVFLFVI